MGVEVLVPLTLFGGPLLLIGYWLYLRAVNRRSVHALVEHAIDKGTPLDAEFVESLGATAPPSPERDLRRGFIYLAVAAAVCVFAAVVEEEVLFALASFPGFIGVAYMLLWLRGKDRVEA